MNNLEIMQFLNFFSEHWLSWAFFALAGIAKGFMDANAHGKFETRPPDSFFGKNSWLRKYKFDKDGNIIKAPNNLYYRTFKIKYKEKFPFSATALVFITDAFHLMQVLYQNFLFLGVGLIFSSDLLLLFIGFANRRVLVNLVFQITYSLIDRK